MSEAELARMAHGLIGCEWGHPDRVRSKYDGAPCWARAEQRVVLYDAGAPVAIVKLCARHKRVVDGLTASHAEA